MNDDRPPEPPHQRTEEPLLKTMARPPGPKPRAIRGRLLSISRDPLSFLFSLARVYGDVVFFDIGPFDVYLLSHPDDVRSVLVSGHHGYMKGQGLQEAKRVLGEGLLTSEGDLHRRQRRLVQPAFHHERLDAYASVMSQYTARARDRWRDGEALDVHQEMTNLTLAIVGKALFDTDMEDGDAAAVREALSAAMDMFNRFTMPFAGLLERLPLPRQPSVCGCQGIARHHRLWAHQGTPPDRGPR
jgi:cytochrome P450